MTCHEIGVPFLITQFDSDLIWKTIGSTRNLYHPNLIRHKIFVRGWIIFYLCLFYLVLPFSCSIPWCPITVAYPLCPTWVLQEIIVSFCLFVLLFGLCPNKIWLPIYSFCVEGQTLPVFVPMVDLKVVDWYEIGRCNIMLHINSIE